MAHSFSNTGGSLKLDVERLRFTPPMVRCTWELSVLWWLTAARRSCRRSAWGGWQITRSCCIRAIAAQRTQRTQLMATLFSALPSLNLTLQCSPFVSARSTVAVQKYSDEVLGNACGSIAG